VFACRLIKMLWLAVALVPADPVSVTAGGTPLSNLGLMYEEPKYLAGRIYEGNSDAGKLLFTFKRVATRSGTTLSVERDYQYPDGKPAAREQVVYEGNDLVLYRLEELQIGAAGSANVRRDLQHPTKGAIDFDYSPNVRTGAKPKSRTESFQNDTLINDTVGPFLAAHWDQLIRGEKVKCRYIVVPRMETVGFAFRKDSETTWHSLRVIIVKMEPSSRIIAALVEPLFFTIETAPSHRVLRYAGRTTPKIQAGGKWKDLDAVTVFDWKP